MQKFLIALVATAIVASPAAAELKKVGAPTGKWHLYSEVDAMTDKKECAAFYEDGNDIQMTGRSFSIGYRGRGGLDAYTLRFDDNPPEQMKIPTRSEKNVGAAYLQGDTYQKVIGAKRLRVRTITLVKGIIDEDIDLSDVPTLLTRLNGPECK